ncbi:MAG: fluoride efflux transporter CrcB [Prevotella sp.]|nr:fluoride efflux transporter CrcB [Prevotella sp.]
MFKEFLLVGCGSFFGGGLRFVVSRLMQAWTLAPYPWGTFTVNVLGCLLIGFLTGLPAAGQWLSPQTRLFLTTGFCGGFTTFSTFMNENHALLREDHFSVVTLYVLASLLVGFLAVLAGHHAARML